MLGGDHGTRSGGGQRRLSKSKKILTHPRGAESTRISHDVLVCSAYRLKVVAISAPTTPTPRRGRRSESSWGVLLTRAGESCFRLGGVELAEGGGLATIACQVMEGGDSR